MYYLNSRYYDPKVGRFINADDYVSTGQGVLGNNMFAYCGNNPTARKDPDGDAFETVFDVVSLGASIVEVATNPADVFAWVGLLGDVIDVAVPFVGGVGEAVDVARGFVEGTDNIVDAAKVIKKSVSKSTGSYEIFFENGNSYVGKGSFERAITSATKRSGDNAVDVVGITWRRAENSKEAFINEYVSMCKYGGPANRGNKSTYNAIASPGRKYYYQKTGRYLDLE